MLGTTWEANENVLGLHASIHFFSEYRCSVLISVDTHETLSGTFLYTYGSQIVTILLHDQQGSFLGKVSGSNMSVKIGDGSEWSVTITLSQALP